MMGVWIKDIFGSNISEWAIWERTQHTCLEIIQKTWEVSYNAGFKDGILAGLIISVVIFIIYKHCFVVSEKAE